MDLFIKNANIVTENDIFPGGILVKDGKISDIVHLDKYYPSSKIIDINGAYLLPGVVDAHVHFHDPGRDYWEGYETGSMAAASGGVTTVIDMPLNGIPPTIDREKLLFKRESIKNKSIVDYAHWAGLNSNKIHEMKGLVDEGVVGFKGFMSGAATDDFENIRDDTIVKAFIEAQNLNCIFNFHAENGDIISNFENEYKENGRTDRKAWLDSHPDYSELEAINRVIFWTKYFQTKTHIAHVSLAEGIDVVNKAKNIGVDITAETCPHYLLFSDEDFLRIGPELKCDPPLRTKENVNALWQCVTDGKVDIISSDHAPCRIIDKQKGDDNIWNAWAGITGLQSILLAILTEGVDQRGLKLDKVVKMLCSNPSRRFGLYPQKGSIAVGSDADFAVIKSVDKWALKADHLFNKNKHSAYINYPFSYSIDRTIIRGKTVYYKNKIQVDPGFGKLVLRTE